MVRKLFALLLSLCVLTGLLPPAAGVTAPPTAEAPVIYDAGSFPGTQHTRYEIARRYLLAQKGYSAPRYARKPSLQAPYDQGEVTRELLDAMVDMGNYLRWLIGVDPLERVQNDDGLQRGALVRNFCFSHFLDDSYKPADMSQSFWNSGNVWHNILAMGYTPVGAMIGWCNEGYSTYSQQWNTIGHRYAILGAELNRLSLGYAGSVAIGRMETYDNVFRQPFAAFPAAGYMPTELLSARNASWTVEYDSSRLRVENGNAVTVTVTNLSSGSSYSCTQANGKLQADGVLNFVQPGCDTDQYADGASYRVRITGLTDVATGKPAELRYEVHFFSVERYCFRDVRDPKQFYFTPVYWAYEHTPRITKGTDSTHFSPSAPCTRGQVVTFLWRAMGCPKPESQENPFKDVKPGSFYYKAVLWAVEKGITKGTSKTAFSPEATCTRGQVVTFLWRSRGKPGIDSDKSFSDVAAGSFYYKAVLWAVEKGITKGASKTTFAPDATCTRGQVVTFLFRSDALPD